MPKRFPKSHTFALKSSRLLFVHCKTISWILSARVLPGVWAHILKFEDPWALAQTWFLFQKLQWRARQNIPKMHHSSSLKAWTTIFPSTCFGGKFNQFFDFIYLCLAVLPLVFVSAWAFTNESSLPVQVNIIYNSIIIQFIIYQLPVHVKRSDNKCPWRNYWPNMTRMKL